MATEDEKAKFTKVNWVFCTVCGGGSIHKSGRRHKRDSGHDVISLKTRERQQPGFMEEALQEFLRITRYGRTGRREVAVEHRRQEEGVVGQDRPEEAQVFRMKFGSYKNKSFAELFGSEETKVEQHILYLFACRSKSGPQDRRIRACSSMRRLVG